ncbi:MAG: NAD(P)-dependent dehydrogenase (short-subunit alcohol dehydrogenase family) [Glaciecola sp.]|jgi:NAD(P)-dependent dehydrogenase (short-subunit alcohol dehydrogenase family)
MRNNTDRTAVVTGASSGVGLEAAAQFATAGYGRVVITARSDAKAAKTADQLRSTTGADVFEAVSLDLDDLTAAAAAAQAIIDRVGTVDALVLNAGIPPVPELRRTDDGIESIAAATLTGHHLLTMLLLDADALSADARIVIAGSEAARGDVPMMNPLDIDALATEAFDGDIASAIDAVLRLQPPVKYHPNNQYATVKVFAAWWAAELAVRLPDGVTVNAVSPGNTPDTNATNRAPAFIRRVMVPVMKLIPGMSHSIAQAAARYVDATNLGPEVTGKFFASPPKKMTGALTEVHIPHFTNPAAQRALFDVADAIVGRESKSAKS